MKMDIRRVFTIQYLVFLLINCINCDTYCDCSKNEAQISWIQKDYTQLKLEMRQENFKIVSRLRRLERAKEAVSSDPPTAEGSSKSRADLEQNKNKMDVKLAQTAEHLERIDKIEDKIIKIEEQLEVTNRNEASFINITAQMNEMDSTFVKVTSQVNDIRDSYKMAFDFRNIISKTIHAEKHGRKTFHANIRNKIENIEHLFSDFKTETTTLVHNLSVPLSTKYDTFTEEMTRQISEMNDQINTNISVELDALTNNVSQTKLSILALNKITNEDKTARNKLNTDIRNQIENIEHLFSDFKAETTTLVHNLSVPLSTKYDTFTVEITRQVAEMNDQINTDITLELDDLTNDVSQMKSRISALNKITIEDKTDGAWGSWGGWSPCSVTCGGGIRWKTRTCTQPKPALQGNYCDGTPIKIRVCKKQTCPDLKVAFTAYGISSTEKTWTVIKFPKTYFNSGGAYSTSTGRFTCKIPGIYHFAVTLTKIRKDINFIYAYIRINGANKLLLYSDPDDTHGNHVDYGSYSLSAAGTFHLNVNDYVHVYGVPSYFYNDFYISASSFFTGFLVIPDTI